MNNSLTVFNAVLPVFCIIAAGFAIRRVGWLTEEADQSLLRLTINVLMPCLILDSVLGNASLTRLGNVLFTPTMGFVSVGIGLAVGLMGRSLAGLPAGPRSRTFALTVGVYNYGYMSIPLAALLFKGGDTMGVLFVFNVGVEAAIWTLGLLVLSGTSLKQSVRKLASPPVISMALALVLNVAGGKDWLPAFVQQTAHMLGQCTIPLGLVLVGATIADQLPEFHAEKGWRVMGAACALRLFGVAALFLLLAKYLPCPVELKQVLVLQSAMPAAVFPIIMARHYGGDPATALRVVIGTTAASFVTIPLVLKLGFQFVGV